MATAAELLVVRAEVDWNNCGWVAGVSSDAFAVDGATVDWLWVAGLDGGVVAVLAAGAPVALGAAAVV